MCAYGCVINMVCNDIILPCCTFVWREINFVFPWKMAQGGKSSSRVGHEGGEKKKVPS